MRLGSVVILSLCCLTGSVFVQPNPAAGAGAFVRFFANQKVGQEITVTGGFRRFPNRDKRRYFVNNTRTGEVEYVEYYGMTMVPSLVAGKGSVSMKASLMARVLLFYSDPALVSDIPLQGDSYWFTGTLIGYQYGTTGITRGMGTGGDPYILLKSVSAKPPEDLPVAPSGSSPGEASPSRPPSAESPSP